MPASEELDGYHKNSRTNLRFPCMYEVREFYVIGRSVMKSKSVFYKDKKI